jgi:hypothetical protein
MLEETGHYKAFCQYLLQEKGLLRKGDWKIFPTFYLYNAKESHMTHIYIFIGTCN